MNLSEVYEFASQVADQMIAEKEEVTAFVTNHKYLFLCCNN